MKVSRAGEQGFTLLEVLIAAVILVVVAAGVLGLFSVALLQNAAAGDHGTRVTEYAQDKMEQLMVLTFSDTASDVTNYPTSSTGGTGLTAGGSINPTSPATGYVDYINGSGSPTNLPSGAVYIRQWKIADDTAQIKTITVRVQKITESKGLIAPSTVLVCQKSSN
jgi:prepilin-type N-terminal cleavage/methylation domain-containing protein